MSVSASKIQNRVKSVIDIYTKNPKIHQKSIKVPPGIRVVEQCSIRLLLTGLVFNLLGQRSCPRARYSAGLSLTLSCPDVALILVSVIISTLMRVQCSADATGL